MNISRFEQTELTNAYGILCASLPKQGDRDGLYPTFCRIPRAGKTIAHAHFEPELFYIVSGNGTLQIENERESVGQGDLIRIPPFAQHQLENIGDDELQFLSVYSEDTEVTSLPSKTVITAAPPTPNGPLHLGHISGPYLASDIVARYLRLRAVDVRSHSGTDDHQNYVLARAQSLRLEPEVFRTRMRSRIQTGLCAMHIEFDQFVEPKLDSQYQEQIREFAVRAIASGVVEHETLNLPHCPQCDHTLVDALIDGHCPSCHEASRGGCENCGLVVPPQDLLSAKCTTCGTPAGLKPSSVYTFSVNRHFAQIREELARLPLSSHLQDLVERVAQMKDLKVLLTHPDPSGDGLGLPGSDQVLHVWFEMAAHYEQFALGSRTWIHCFGFDNSFYYLIFIPALLRALNPQAKLPEVVITNEFLLLDGLKFSTSRGHAIWADEFTGNTDHLRMYLSLQRPTTLQTDFSLGVFRRFSMDLEHQLEKLQQRAHVVAGHIHGDVRDAVIVDCNRFTREMERFYSPQTFDPRRAGRQLLAFMDHALQSAGQECGERLMLQTLATLMAPIMPTEAGKLLQILGHASPLWRTDWARADEVI